MGPLLSQINNLSQINCFKNAGSREKEGDAVCDDSFITLKDTITRPSNLNNVFDDVNVDNVASFDHMLVSTQGNHLIRISWKALYLLIFMLGHESEDEKDSQSEVYEVLVKPNRLKCMQPLLH